MAKKKKGGGNHKAKAHAPHGVKDVKSDGMAHATHGEMNAKHGTPAGFAAGDEYQEGEAQGGDGMHTNQCGSD